MQSTLFTTIIWDNAFLFQSQRGGLVYRLVCIPRKQAITVAGEAAACMAHELVRLEQTGRFDVLMGLWKLWQANAKPLGREGILTLPTLRMPKPGFSEYPSQLARRKIVDHRPEDDFRRGDPGHPDNDMGM